ncbi:MAG: hypothetical protein HON68_01245 [Gammaproteobacteria bacterium]|jgi:ketopantoate reductase|nr:hypothetical protein [Gammaproteobacteria bacterium]MBT3893252.1 hypothetical protein [Gammaproteobacteria bacterium]MBT4787739.1 hypothetical protein [Gammaproteobacteria bacterium]MBT5372620.1 hypothetical protein [Gammaproteobacteria bacterium]MBT6478471.1 hypothetical protein [Gammaproteobacteria bacterium]
MSQQPVILIGAGEMGGVFARGLLRAGYPVHPVTRDISIQSTAAAIPQPELVLVAVAEGDLQPVLEEIPAAWKDRLVLLQNELLPRDWSHHDLTDPTVISVWFEKKRGMDFKVIIPSPVFGPYAETIARALATLEISTKVLTTPAELLQELVLKNVYILTTNIAGLKTGGNVGELWDQHQPLARTIAYEVIDLQQWLTGETLNREALVDGMVEAFDGDLNHNCMGRSAPARLQRALQLADEAEIELPTMRKISQEL